MSPHALNASCRLRYAKSSSSLKRDHSIRYSNSRHTCSTPQPSGYCSHGFITPRQTPRIKQSFSMRLPPQAFSRPIPCLFPRPLAITLIRRLMRYGEIVNATLQGQVDSYNQLPRHGQLGDAWIVAGTPWIWTHPSGSAFTTWIDP
jgi:hypothetical protein